MIGTIPTDSDAERFSDYLVTQQIGNMVEESAAGDWSVWVENDDQLDRAKSELHAFLQNPVDPKYGVAVRAAESIRKEQAKQQRKKRTEYVDVRTRWGQPSQWNAPVTLILIALSCVISVGTGSMLGGRHVRQQAVDLVTFTSVQPGTSEKWEQDHPEVQTIFTARTGYWLEHLKHGQVWRLVTPIFIHWSIFHLLFNLFFLRDLGGMIEVQRGTRVMLPLVLAVAILSNIAQYYWEGPSAFGGMSGVNYGLFAYVWVKGRYQTYLGLGISQQSTMILIAWLFLCMTGWVGDIANMAHVVGLLVGGAIAYAPIGVKKVQRKAEG
jgi:GlpG protein